MVRTTGIFPGWTGYFPREKSGEFKGKIRLAHVLHPKNLTSEPPYCPACNRTVSPASPCLACLPLHGPACLHTVSPASKESHERASARSRQPPHGLACLNTVSPACKQSHLLSRLLYTVSPASTRSRLSVNGLSSLHTASSHGPARLHTVSPASTLSRPPLHCLACLVTVPPASTRSRSGPRLDRGVIYAVHAPSLTLRGGPPHCAPGRVSRTTLPGHTALRAGQCLSHCTTLPACAAREMPGRRRAGPGAWAGGSLRTALGEVQHHLYATFFDSGALDAANRDDSSAAGTR